MNEYCQTKGIVLVKNDFREADQLFRVYTKDFGKIEILGKAIRKIKSKLRAGIDILCFSEIEFVQGRVYKTLIDARVIEKFKNIKKDFEKLKIGFQIGEASDILIKGEEADEKIFDFLEKSLEDLDKLEEKSVSKYHLFYCYFVLNFISLLGYAPNLYNCFLCQKKFKPEKIFLSREDFSIICSQCAGSLKDKIEIGPEIIKIIRVFLEKDWSFVLRLKGVEDYLEKLKEICYYYLNSCL